MSDPCDGVDLVITEEEEDAGSDQDASEAEEARGSAGHDARLSILQSIESIESIEDLPAEISAREWRSLAGRLEWSSSRRSYLFRPELGDDAGSYAGAPGHDSREARASRRPMRSLASVRIWLILIQERFGTLVPGSPG